MTLQVEAKKLVNYINSIGLQIPTRQPSHGHVGAIIADAVLQIGHGYKKQVSDRVVRLRERYPEAATVSGLLRLLGTVGAERLLDGWTGQQEHKRLHDHAKFFDGKGIDTFDELATWLQNNQNRASLMTAGLGIRDKTADYYRVLARDPDAVKVDSRVEDFLKAAGISVETYAYEDLRTIVQLAAKQLGKRPVDLDGAIWNYKGKTIHKGGRNSMSTGTLKMKFAYAFAAQSHVGIRDLKQWIDQMQRPQAFTNHDYRRAQKGEIAELLAGKLGSQWPSALESFQLHGITHGQIAAARLRAHADARKRFENTPQGEHWLGFLRTVYPAAAAPSNATILVDLPQAQYAQLKKKADDWEVDERILAKIWILERLS